MNNSGAVTQQAANSAGKGFNSGASPHSVWTNLADGAPEQGLSGGSLRQAEVAETAAAAEASKQMADTVSGVVAEAGRLAADIASAGTYFPYL